MLDSARYNEHSKPANAVAVLSDVQSAADAGIIMGTTIHRTDSALYVLTRFAENPGSVTVSRIVPQVEGQKMDTASIGYADIRNAITATQPGKINAVEALLEAAF